MIPLILVLDDDRAFSQATTRTLEEEGYRVLAASDGARGLEIFQLHAPDLVITDIMMPEKDGIETIIDLRRLQPNAKIIAMSSGGRSGRVELLTEIVGALGVVATLIKPFSRQELIIAVRNALGESLLP